MLTLTPNRRLAAFLLQQHNTQQAKLHKNSWETPQIYPLEAWISQLWQLCLENTNQASRPLLNVLQQQVLWEQIIQDSSVGVELLRINPTAKNALQAWKFLCQWQVSINKLAAYAEFSVDTQAFYIWLQVYLQWLEDNNYLDFGLMVNKLITLIPFISDKLPSNICLMGIDDMPPQYAKLIAVIAEHGVTIEHKAILVAGAATSRSEFSNEDTELTAAAAWAQQQIQINSKQTIGVVIPELESKRQKVVRIFTRVLPTEIMNISAPLCLSSYQVIDTALLILQLAKPVINFNDFSILLRSAYIADSESEINLRALLDRALREQAEAKISWGLLQQLIINSETSFINIINNFSGHNAKLNGKHHAEYWVDKIQQLLAIWGWPGNRGLTLEETHLLSCWQDLLHCYCQLAIVVPEHTFNQALKYIQRLAVATPFLPAETGLTKVHILGILEAAGLVFDQLWVTGMDRDSWPPDAAPNPFIPLELQRQVDIPRSSPQRELKVAKRLTATLLQGARQNVIFSYAQHASNLIVDLTMINKYSVKNLEQNSANISLETITDAIAPNLNVTEQILGGANILKLQVQCPFKAYAEIRLQAKALIEPPLYLTAADRGNLVHEILENFWQQCNGSAQLITWPPAQTNNLLSNIIQASLSKLQHKRPHTLQANYFDLEYSRLLNLITRWLDYEKQRAAFTVKALEEKIIIKVGDLMLKLRIDRLDLLADGTEVIIDYKTGTTEINSWLTEDILEPQLPLYTLHYADNLVALAIANIKPDLLSFKGVGQNKNLLPDIKIIDNWSEQLNIWRDNLTNIANSFVRGVAAVVPYTPQICKTCSLQTVCRIYDC